MAFSPEDVGDIPGKPPLTVEERKAIADEWNAAHAAAPLERWRERMALADATLPRWAEDLFDAMPDDAKAKVAQATAERVAAKKALRAQRPA